MPIEPFVRGHQFLEDCADGSLGRVTGLGGLQWDCDGL